MDFAPIKLQDFAKQNGVTDRAIQRHIKKHEKELQGHVIRKGPNGTWMDEFAQMYVKNLLREHPIVVSEVSEQVTNLQAENKRLLEALNDAKDIIIDLKDQNAELRLQTASVARLEADNEAVRQKAAQAVDAAQKAQGELTAAQERERLLREYAAALEEWCALGWLKRRRTPKPTPPAPTEK